MLPEGLLDVVNRSVAARSRQCIPALGMVAGVPIPYMPYPGGACVTPLTLRPFSTHPHSLLHLWLWIILRPTYWRLRVYASLCIILEGWGTGLIGLFTL